jgi:DNA-binding XRE family transcriptional regulator
MTAYVDSIAMSTIHCCTCGVVFGMSEDFIKRRREDHKTFYCPAGHGQNYTGLSEATKLRTELERKEQMLEAEHARTMKMERERNEIQRAHTKMRQRIVNGVCPCCNRTFQNLLRHMQTEHAGTPSLKVLRDSYGLSQGALAREIGVSQAQVSCYEKEKPVASYAKKAIESWVTSQQTKAYVNNDSTKEQT